jgi:hypothetical protein
MSNDFTTDFVDVKEQHGISGLVYPLAVSHSFSIAFGASGFLKLLSETDRSKENPGW